MPRSPLHLRGEIRVDRASASKRGDDNDCKAKEATPHPIKMTGVMRNRQIGNVRARKAWTPNTIKTAKSAKTHFGVFCRITTMLGIEPPLLRYS